MEKVYVDLKRKEIKYGIGEKVFLKVSPWNFFHFACKAKLSPIESIEVQPDLVFQEELVDILPR